MLFEAAEIVPHFVEYRQRGGHRVQDEIGEKQCVLQQSVQLQEERDAEGWGILCQYALGQRDLLFLLEYSFARLLQRKDA